MQHIKLMIVSQGKNWMCCFPGSWSIILFDDLITKHSDII